MTSIAEERKWEEMRKECYALVDALPQLIWIVRPDGSVVYTNQRWLDYSGGMTPNPGKQIWDQQHEIDDCPPIQLGQQTPALANLFSTREIWPQNLHPDDREYVLALRHRAFATHEPCTIRYRLREGRTGIYRWFLSQVVPYRNEAGAIVVWMISCTDIDDQKQTEDTLRQSQERVNLLMNSSRIGIFVAEDDEIVDANATFLRMTGYCQEDLGSAERPVDNYHTSTRALLSRTGPSGSGGATLQDSF